MKDRVDKSRGIVTLITEALGKKKILFFFFSFFLFFPFGPLSLVFCKPVTQFGNLTESL
jgi:hypothetical protein